MKSCVLTFRIFVGLTFSTLERGPVSVWTNYSALPTEPGRRAGPKKFVPTVPVVQSLRSVQIVQNIRRLRERRIVSGIRIDLGKSHTTVLLTPLAFQRVEPSLPARYSQTHDSMHERQRNCHACRDQRAAA